MNDVSIENNNRSFITIFLLSIYRGLGWPLFSALGHFCLSTAFILAPIHSYASPEGATVTHGNLELSQNGQQLDINQTSQHAIANWQSFSIGTDEIVNIQQLNANAALLNRVTGADPSQLLGQLNSNGQVFLINPNGVLVGENAHIDAGEFIATTLDISDSDFLNGGDLEFSGDSTAGILNLGSITSSNGDIVLIASKISNEGLLKATEGQIALGAGNEVLLTNQNNQRLIVKSDLSQIVGGIGIDNSGVIDAAETALVAAGGDIYDLAINQSGIIKATGVENRNGRILLTAEGGDILFSGEARASDVDGSGGEVLLGGDYRGENSNIVNAANIHVSDTAIIDVSAEVQRADAGRAIVWSDNQTNFLGFIDGRAGDLGGNGAFVEVSGKRVLNYRGIADLSALNGVSGQLLLDPDALTIQAAGSDTDLTTSGTDPFEFAQSIPGSPALAPASILTVATLQNQLAISNVILDASAVTGDVNGNGNITVNDAVAWGSGNSLTLDAGNDITINADIDAGSGDLILDVGYLSDTTTANLFVDAGAALTANTLTLGGGTSDIEGSSSTNGTIGSIIVNGSVNVSTLDIQLNNAFAGLNIIIPDGGIGFSGVEGDVSIANAGNQIGALVNTGNDDRIGGSLTVVDSSGGLSISGEYLATGEISISTMGDLTLNAGTAIITDHFGSDIVVAAENGSFINNGGVVNSEAEGAGRYLIYSDNPDDTVLGELELLIEPVYNRTFAANAPATITASGNRVLYSLAPTLVLTANDVSREENEVNPSLTYTVSGLVGDDTASSVFSGDPLLSTAANVASPEGDYAISIANGTVALSDYGYGLSLLSGTLTVEDGLLPLLTVTADDFDRIYGESNPSFTASITGFLGGDDVSLVSGLQFTTTATPQSPVGNYTITPYDAVATDYRFGYVEGTLTIDLRDLTITADSGNKIFGEELASGFSATGLAPFDTVASLGAVTTTSGGAAALASVGNYNVVASGVTNTNYDVTYIDGAINISPAAALTITANNASRAFGAANPDFGISTSGLVSGDSLDTASLVFTTAADISSSVGTYSVTPSGISDANYSGFTYVAGSLDIAAAQLTFTVNNASRDYGSANPGFTFTSSGLLAGDTLADVVTDITLSTTATQGSSVGTYDINLTATQIDNNYNPVINMGELDINQVDVDLFLEPASRFYGDSDPAPNVAASGLVNGDSASVFGNIFVNYLAAPSSNVGSYTVQFLGAADTRNYRVRSINNGTLNVLPRPLTITADNFTREYGDENPELTASYSGLASFDDASDINGVNLSTVATTSSSPLDYGISLTSGSNPNYSVSTVSGLLTVTPAVLTIEIGDTESIYGRGIGELDPTVSFFTGLKLDDLPNELGFALATEATNSSGAGEYAINATLTNSNYALDIRQAGTLLIRPAPLDVSLSNFSRIYGEADPEFTFELAGLALGDSSDVVSIMAPDLTADAGTYSLDITLNTANYQLANITGGLFTILPRNIAIKLDNIVRFYGDPDPAFNYLIAGDGLASFDTIDDVAFANDPLVTGSFGQQAPVGTRTTIAQLTGNPNYSVANQQGYYAILPRPIEISVDDATAIGNFPLPGFTATATNLAEFDTLDSAIPDLIFQIFQEDELAPLQAVVNLDDVEIPAAFQNDQFFTKFPSTIEEPTSEFEADPGFVTSEITPIEITEIPGTSVSPVVTFGTIEITSTISSSLFSAEEQESEESIVQYIQAIGSNPNYVIVGNTNGTLTWDPDPEVAAIRREIEAEQAIYNEAYDAFYNPDEVYGPEGDEIRITSTSINNNLLGLPDGAQQTVLEAVGAALLGGNEDLADMISIYGSEARGTANFNQLTGGAYSDFDTLAFLQAARTDPQAAEMLGTIMTEYVMDMIDVDPANYSSGQQVLAEHMSSHINAAKQGIAQSAEAKYNAWAEEQESRSGSLTDLFGSDTPYDTFIGDAAADYLEEHIAGKAAVIAGGAAGGVAVAATTGVLMSTATSVVLPFTASVMAAKTATIAAGGTVGTVTGVGAAAAVVPVAIIAVAVAGSIARAVQVVGEEQQRNIYETLTDTSVIQLSDLTQTETGPGGNERDNTINQVILATALSSMFSGV